MYRKGPSVARTYPKNKEIQNSAPGKRQESLRGSAISEEDLQGSSSTNSSDNTRSVSDMTRSGSPGDCHCSSFAGSNVHGTVSVIPRNIILGSILIFVRKARMAQFRDMKIWTAKPEVGGSFLLCGVFSRLFELKLDKCILLNAASVRYISVSFPLSLIKRKR